MKHPGLYSPEAIAQAIVQHCRTTNRRLVFISGNGGSGKTELSKAIAKEAEKYGRANVLNMDDFVVDTNLRSSATASWNDPEKGPQTGRYTTAFAESYFLQSVKAVLYSLERGNDYYHWPKKAQAGTECRLLFADAILTIVEGTGTVFLERDASRSISIFVQCSPEIEVARRIQRARFSNEQGEADVRKNFAERNSQYRAMIEPHKEEFGFVLESIEDYSLRVLRDDYQILSRKRDYR
jgi:uridine kinase